jgi:hypothetical protein
MWVMGGKFVLWLWLLRALSTINVFLVCLEDDVSIEGILVEVLLLTRPEVSYFFLRVYSLMVTVDHSSF